METNLSFLSEFRKPLLITLGMIIPGIIIVRYSEKYSVAGIVLIIFGLVFGVQSCSVIRSRVNRSKIELCGITLNADVETARMKLHRFGESCSPEAVYIAGIDSSGYSLGFRDSINNISLNLKFSVAHAFNRPQLISAKYTNSNGVPLKVLETYSGELSDYIGKQAGIELIINDSTITIISR